MKKNIFIIIAFLSALATTPTPSLAAFCMSCARDECTSTLDFRGHCAAETFSCLNKNCAWSCSSCESGYKLEAHTFQPDGCSNSKTVYSCVKESSGGGTEPEPDCDALCEECLPPFQIPSWTPVDNNPGYKSKTTTICNEETGCLCQYQVTYGCADGYYGTNPSCIIGWSCQGCTKCPSLGDVEGKTAVLLSSISPGGGETITDCFISANTELKDSTGTYVFESKCNYKQ